MQRHIPSGRERRETAILPPKGCVSHRFSGNSLFGEDRGPLCPAFLLNVRDERGNADIKYTPNASSDHGFGIFQLTNNPKPSAQQLWSWHANCDDGISRLSDAQAYANSWMASQRRQMSDEGFSISVPPKTYGNVTFAENTPYIIEHAVALKRYNGATGGNFCAWDNKKHCWKFNEKNHLKINYVLRICSEVP